MLYALLLFVHVFVSISLIICVLLQSGKGGGLAGTFGGTSGGVFGGRGAAPFLIKATAAFAILFMVTSISLNFVTSQKKSESVLQRTLMKSGMRPSSSQPAVMDKMPISSETPQKSGTAGNSGNTGRSGESQPAGGTK